MLRLLARRVETVPRAGRRDLPRRRARPRRIRCGSSLGELGTAPGVARLRLAPLSLEAVARARRAARRRRRRALRQDRRQPVLRHRGAAPATARSAGDGARRGARARRAAWPGARGLLEAVAVVPPQAELWLLEASSPRRGRPRSTSACLRACCAPRTRGRRSGTSSRGSPSRNRSARIGASSCTARALAALARAARRRTRSGAARAPRRGRRRRRGGAALRAGRRRRAARWEPTARPPRSTRARCASPTGCRSAERAELLERHAYECYLTDQFDEAIDAQERALECHRELGDRRSEGDCAALLSEMLWCPGRIDEAERAGREAVDVLEASTPGRELALAYANLATLCVRRRRREAIEWGTRRSSSPSGSARQRSLLGAASTSAAAELRARRVGGGSELERGLELAAARRVRGARSRASGSPGAGRARARATTIVDRYVEGGLAYCEERDFEMLRRYLHTHRARAALERARWAEATDAATLVLHDPGPVRLRASTRSCARSGASAARRSGAWELLDRRRRLAERQGQPQRSRRSQRREPRLAWLEGRPEAIADVDRGRARARSPPGAWREAGELARWRRRAGCASP